MPMKIRDSGISKFYSNLASTTGAKPDMEQALKVLSMVGDRQGHKAAAVLKELSQPGMTQQAQIGLVKRGMSKNEKSDLIEILDKGTVPLRQALEPF